AGSAEPESPGLRVVRVGGEDRGRDQPLRRVGRAVAPMVPGLVGRALPGAEHALVPGAPAQGPGADERDARACFQKRSATAHGSPRSQVLYAAADGFTTARSVAQLTAQ